MESLDRWKNIAAEYIADFLDLLQTHLFTLSVSLQFGVFVVSSIVAFMLARKASLHFRNWLDRHQGKYLIIIHGSYKELFFLFILDIFLWLGVLVFAVLEQDFYILKTMASLIAAWGIIRLISGTITNQFWAKIIGFVLAVIVTLSILDLLTPVTELMDSLSVTFAKTRISLLLVVKAIIIFALLIWIIGVASRVLERGFNGATGLTSSQRVLFYKISNIFLYAAAIFFGLNLIGLDLTALAVFGGGLGLGIGFGLQKIFSNLISGFILLVDKSVKPGDVIAIGDTYGWVNTLGARYVSVLTRDGKEHLIPNEQVISDQVENWSYSDTNIRIHVPIGVSYNADVHKVKEILLQAADNSPRVLKSKPVVCLLKEFGDNSINFELRVWIADPQQGVSNIKSEIYFRIWDLFKENDIEIPFPQRDVHVKLDDEAFQALLKLKGNTNG